ncbi:M15 family metallopeptidase [Macrococcus equi]|uniref:M15 family metallopeptidase n=1 Tax=Macrococcus equi TaxID=3395462 RepID=UPI0039BECBCC
MKKFLIASVLLLSSCSLPNLPLQNKEKAEENKTTEQVTKKTQAVQQKAPRYNKKVIHGVTYINGIIIVNKHISLPPSYNPGENKRVRSIIDQMIQDAKKDNMHLVVRSAYRSYAAQKTLYEQFVQKDGQSLAETYSARPGQSEHQTGLAFDIGSRESVANLNIQFGQTPEGKWLKDHAHLYGFIIRYGKNKTHITGYRYEPWHIRYVGKTHAAKLYKSGQSLEEYLGLYKRSRVTHQAVHTKNATTEEPVKQINTLEQPLSTELPLIEPVTTEGISTEQPFIAPQETEQPLLSQ